jgi:hypothetical protein
MTCRAFRDLLEKRGELTEELVVRSLVPVSIRGQDERGVVTNRVSAVLANLPVSEPDPVQRLKLIREQMDSLKHTYQAVSAEILTGMLGFAAPMWLALGSRAAFRIPQPLVQTVTTNVPGPRYPLYILGRRMEAAYPYVPIGNSVRISVAMFSYLDTISFGITTDYDFLPDLDIMIDGIGHGLAELGAHPQQAAPAPKPARPARKTTAPAHKPAGPGPKPWGEPGDTQQAGVGGQARHAEDAQVERRGQAPGRQQHAQRLLRYQRMLPPPGVVHHQRPRLQVGDAGLEHLADRPALRRLVQLPGRRVGGHVVHAAAHIGIDRHDQVADQDLARSGIGQLGGHEPEVLGRRQPVGPGRQLDLSRRRRHTKYVACPPGGRRLRGRYPG